jgi:hypothetical protein
MKTVQTIIVKFHLDLSGVARPFGSGIYFRLLWAVRGAQVLPPRLPALQANVEMLQM